MITEDIAGFVDKTSEKYIDFISDVRGLRERHWLSIFYQLSTPACLRDVHSVLEFGPGRGVFGVILKHYGLEYCSADVVDSGAKPDFMCNISDFPQDKKFDLVCAFQVLEHNPPETYQIHLRKMAEISNKYVFISLPYYGRWLSFNISLNIPGINRNFIKTFTMDRLFPKKRPIEAYRQSKTPYSHHWFEVGDEGFKKKDLAVYAEKAGLKIVNMQHSHSFPYHVFLLMEKI